MYLTFLLQRILCKYVVLKTNFFFRVTNCLMIECILFSQHTLTTWIRQKWLRLMCEFVDLHSCLYIIFI